ncbi:MAG: hypothetical protein HGA94_04270, partial [Candidatus Aminicenantes bacterium]|nr:hypothetical protein [Candidatus Aminicenantes bacterium]
EMFGNRALYHDGWLAGTKVMRAPWVQVPPKVGVMDYRTVAYGADGFLGLAEGELRYALRPE